MLRVEGHPQTQGSTRGFAIPGKGTSKARVVITSTNKNLKPWRQQMKDAFTEQLSTPDKPLPRIDNSPYFQEAVSVVLDVILPRLACHAKLKAGQVPSVPLSGDLDKYQRAVGDSLTDAKVIKDDKYIEEWVAFKRYACVGEAPGVIVTVSGYVDVDSSFCPACSESDLQ